MCCNRSAGRDLGRHAGRRLFQCAEHASKKRTPTACERWRRRRRPCLSLDVNRFTDLPWMGGGGDDDDDDDEDDVSGGVLLCQRICLRIHVLVLWAGRSGFPSGYRLSLGRQTYENYNRNHKLDISIAPAKEKSQKPAYSEDLFQNKIDRQWVRFRESGR